MMRIMVLDLLTADAGPQLLLLPKESGRMERPVLMRCCEVVVVIALLMIVVLLLLLLLAKRIGSV